MVTKYLFLFLMFNVFVFCECSYVDSLTKCKISDGNCLKKLLQKILKDIGPTGIPEIGLKPIDPISLSNVTVDVSNIFEITLVEGQVKGIKKCVVDKFEVNIEDERAFVELTCDIVVIGKYKAYSASPVIKNLLNGDSIKGDGNGKVKVEKIKIKFDFHFYIQKRDGEYYIKCKCKETGYTMDIKGKMLFFADNLYVGEVESSKVVTQILNENWRLMNTLQKPFMDKAMEYVYEFINQVFDGVSIKYFISDDLSSYARE